MAAGGYKEFIAGSILGEDDINDYLMQGVLVFAGTAARGSAITSPVEGQFAFLKDTDQLTYYSGSAWEDFESGLPEFNFLVVAGGGSGAAGNGRAPSGGGAGGYRCSVTGESSGGSAVAESSVFLESGSYTVTVGAGGAGQAQPAANQITDGVRGNSSRFASIVCMGGGGGFGQSNIWKSVNGGSGAGQSGSLGFDGQVQGYGGTLGQGSDGGNANCSTSDPGAQSGGGGGGAGAVGANAASGSAGNGGAGLASSITGSSVTRGGGGGGAKRNSPQGSTGGSGGGGAGGAAGTAGTVNTGGGGGASAAGASGSGGSGIVIVKYVDTITLTIGGGLTSSTTSAGGFKITSFTAGTDTVSF
jgi:hypothetical protein